MERPGFIIARRKDGPSRGRRPLGASIGEPHTFGAFHWPQKIQVGDGWGGSANRLEAGGYRAQPRTGRNVK